MTLYRNIVEIYGCVTRHHPVWAGSRSWVSWHLSLHLSIRGDEVRVCSCLIFRYRIWPKKQCILEKHSNLLQKYNSCRLLLTITHKYLSSHETRKHRHIFARVAAFWQRVFQTLPNLDVHPGVAVYHTLKIFSNVNAKDLLMPHTKFQVCTLKINTIFCHRKKNPITFEQECTFTYLEYQTTRIYIRIYIYIYIYIWYMCVSVYVTRVSISNVLRTPTTNYPMHAFYSRLLQVYCIM